MAWMFIFHLGNKQLTGRFSKVLQYINDNLGQFIVILTLGVEFVSFASISLRMRKKNTLV